MQQTLAKLENKCKDLGLEVIQTGKRPSKDDFVRALRAHFMPPHGLPYEELTPMLCFPEYNLTEEERQMVWESKNWAAQRKLNGCRAVEHFIPDVGVFAHSRIVSLLTYRFSELTESLLYREFKDADRAYTIDCEFMIEKPVDTRPYTAKGEVTKSSLHSTTAVLHLEPKNGRKLQVEQNAPLIAHVFDIMRFGDKDLRNMPLAIRLSYLKEFANWILTTSLAPYFKFPPLSVVNKRALFDQTIKEGGEGLVLKNLASTYEDSSSRRRDSWVKVKKRIEFDAFVSGFLRGETDTGWRNLVGALEMSVIDQATGNQHVIAMVKDFPMADRQAMTIYYPTTDTVNLDQAWYGRVAEVSGQDVTPRVLRLSHATIERWRNVQGPDFKDAADCQVDMQDLRKRAEWVG